MILPKTKQQIKEHALSCPKEEVCGFIFEDGSIYRARNESKNPVNHFLLAPTCFIKASQIGKIYAIYHSHIGENYNFSEFDKLNADNHKFNYLVYSIGADSFNFYPHNSQVNQYSGKDFKIGVHDCYSLVADYYKNEFGYTIRDGGLVNNRQDDWLANNPNVFDQIFELNKVDLVQFNPKDKAELTKGDILMFNYFKPNGSPHHLGIYLGDDYFIHHPRRKFSQIEQMDSLYFHWIHTVIRLRS